MIQHTIATWQDLSWQDELKSLITDPAELLNKLKLDQDLLPKAKAAARNFPLRVTPSFVAKMKIADPHDPLLRQVLPIGAELRAEPGYSPDPLEERAFNPIRGLVHKYHNRVLIVAATSCAINCRYCFRREFDYKNNRLSKQDWQTIFDYITERPHIDEVILSGGDPLLHPDKHFDWLIAELDNITHLERIRIHSRLPIVLPSRINDAFLSTFSRTRLDKVLVAHCNHAAEIDASVGAALTNARNAGFSVLNQTVLLKGVNDQLSQQIALSKRLFQFQVLPYYLHLLDKVSGSAHFDVDTKVAYKLYTQMKSRLPGYLLPKLVREEAGEDAKTVISPR